MTYYNHLSGHTSPHNTVACLVFDGGEQTVELAYRMVSRGTNLALICTEEDKQKAQKVCRYAIAHHMQCLIIAGNPRSPTFAHNAIQQIQDHYNRLDYYFDLTSPTTEHPMPNYLLMGKAFQQKKS